MGGSQWLMDASVMKRKPLGNICDRANAGCLGQTFTHNVNESLRKNKVFKLTVLAEVGIKLCYKRLQQNCVVSYYLLLKKWTFTNTLCRRDPQRSECKSEQEGQNASLKESIMNTVRDQRRRSAARGFGAVEMKRKWRGQENCVRIRMPECVGGRTSGSGEGG